MNLKTTALVLLIALFVVDLGDARYYRRRRRRRSPAVVLSRYLTPLYSIGVRLRSTGTRLIRLYSLYRRVVLRRRFLYYDNSENAAASEEDSDLFQDVAPFEDNEKDADKDEALLAMDE